MIHAKRGAGRAVIAFAFVLSGALIAVGPRAAGADVTAVTGGAFGVSAPNITLGALAQPPYGPTPTVTLPGGGSAAPVTGHDNSESAGFGPATLFESGPIDVSTKGTTGASGSVTSTTTITSIPKTGGEQFGADSMSATCNASEAGTTGSTTVTNGEVDTHTEGGVATSNEGVPVNPTPNHAIDGVLVLSSADTETFTDVFNEQTVNADGSITVTALHEILHGPFAKGDVYIGRVVCGVTAGGGTTTTTAAGGTTTTTAAGGTTTTTAPTTTPNQGGAGSTTTTTAPLAQVGGGAYGYFTSVGLFGGAPATRGPTPKVELPPGGSEAPLTASAPSGEAVYGPAQIFTSGAIEVSTQGTPASGSVTSSATVNSANKSGTEQFTAATVTSKCTASASGVSGSTTLTGGKLKVSSGNPNVDGDDKIVPLPNDPAPNTSFDGKAEDVGDTFRVVVNEQKTSAGTITVNAMHMYLLGPAAKGEAIVGQVRCASTAAGASPDAVNAASGGSGSDSGSGSGSGGGGLASTGAEVARWALMALWLLLGGVAITRWSQDRRVPNSVRLWQGGHRAGPDHDAFRGWRQGG